MIASRCIQIGRDNVREGNQLKILVVDNNASVRALMGLVLKGMHHTDIMLAGNGREALTLLKKRSTDLIISAWSMPEMGGLELLKACKRDPALKNIPFVLMGSEHQQTITALEAGADAYLAKPFSPEELQEVLRRVRPSGQ